MAASPRVSLEIHQAPGAGTWLIGSPASPSFDLDSTSFEPPNTSSTSPSSPGTRTASCAVLDHCCDHAVVCPCGKPQLATTRSHTFSLKRRRQGSTLRSKESSQLQPRPNRPADDWIPHGQSSTSEAWDFAVFFLPTARPVPPPETSPTMSSQGVPRHRDQVPRQWHPGQSSRLQRTRGRMVGVRQDSGILACSMSERHLALNTRRSQSRSRSANLFVTASWLSACHFVTRSLGCLLLHHHQQTGRVEKSSQHLDCGGTTRTCSLFLPPRGSPVHKTRPVSKHLMPLAFWVAFAGHAPYADSAPTSITRPPRFPSSVFSNAAGGEVFLERHNIQKTKIAHLWRDCGAHFSHFWRFA